MRLNELDYTSAGASFQLVSLLWRELVARAPTTTDDLSTFC
ncbi:hypothetical protein [Capnocytophaga granulosa]|nr:hypothetical protein [Capnocytophaga granulosa]